jgi:hypothetical protein
MSWAGQVIVSYAVVLGGLAAYAASIVVRGRRLSRELPAEERRWM